METLKVSFGAYFKDIQDSRRYQGRRYPLRDILLMAVFAAVSDCDDWMEMVECCEQQVAPGAFERCFLYWMKDIATAHQCGVVAMDGDINEIATVPALLKELMLNNCIVTMDAAHCQTENT